MLQLDVSQIEEFDIYLPGDITQVAADSSLANLVRSLTGLKTFVDRSGLVLSSFVQSQLERLVFTRNVSVGGQSLCRLLTKKWTQGPQAKFI